MISLRLGVLEDQIPAGLLSELDLPRAWAIDPPIQQSPPRKGQKMDDLDKKMKAAGMVPLSEILAGTPVDRFRVHTGVQDVSSFLSYAEKKHEQYARMFAEIELGEAPKDEMYEWILAHMAVWSDVVFNLRAALERSQVAGN